MNVLKQLLYVLMLAIPFGTMDLVIRQLSRQINYKSALHLPSVLFSLIWMFLLVFIPSRLKRKAGRIIYLEEMNVTINRLIQKNDWVLKYDYFRRLEKAS